MQQLTPARALTRRAVNQLLMAASLGLLGLLLAIVGAFLYLVPLAVPDNPSFPAYDALRQALLALATLGFGLGVLISGRAIFRRPPRPAAALVSQALAQHLDARYTTIRHLSHVAYGALDAVLIGPPGLLVLRTLTREGIFFNQGGKWMQQRDQGAWRALNWSPSEAAQRDVRRLQAYLTRKGHPHVPINAAVIFTGQRPTTTITREHPAVPVLQTQDLPEALRRVYLDREARLSSAQARAIIALLTD